MTRLLYGISGVARAGKDTFASLLEQHLMTTGWAAARIAFADELKRELDPVLLQLYGISAFTADPVEKTIIRPFLVAHGKARRDQTEGAYWIDKVKPQVKDWMWLGRTAIVTDVRYANEAAWIHSLGGKVVYVQRINPNGSIVGPANPEEAENDPKVRAAADLVVSWPTVDANSLDQLVPYVHDAWSQLTKSP